MEVKRGAGEGRKSEGEKRMGRKRESERRKREVGVKVDRQEGKKMREGVR